ncbi:unnamed protein product [marine sediment metagenome]|uniref:PemK-like protein n=1 Tax=marine sediment metagenome TaxID=412755 RepID=X0UR76_9ZZZZ
MKPGKLALLRFPHVDLEEGKLRPVLLIARVPGDFPDWLVAMVSSRLEHAIPGVDELIREEDADFPTSGLKQSSVIRIGRLAVANAELFLGASGEISGERLAGIRHRIADWILEKQP